MRELATAIVISVLIVGGVLLLPYSIDKSPPPQTAQTARPAAEPVQSDAAPAHQHAQNTAQTAAGGGGDREQGRQVYRKCQACHSLEAGKNSVGPTLAGIIGKKAASDPDYAYSPALRASGLTWDVATLNQYLLDPQKLVPGNKMPFPGLKTENERRDVIAYLASSATAATSSPPAATPAPTAPPQRGSVSYIPDIRYTLRSGIAEGRMVFIGSGGTIDGQISPLLSAAEGQVVQITLINGEGAEHDIVFPDQNAKSPRITGRGSSTTLAFRAERAGDFSYLCSVPGHELAGMKGQFLVTPRPPAQTVVEAIISREATDLPPSVRARRRPSALTWSLSSWRAGSRKERRSAIGRSTARSPARSCEFASAIRSTSTSRTPPTAA
jgi:nitrite reductase (NO-forming)